MVHEFVRKHIASGFAPGEWELIGLAHPVVQLYVRGRRADGDRLLREHTAAHESGHAILGLTLGLDVRRVVVAHLHEIQQGGTIGFAEYRQTRRTAADPLAAILHCLGGIAGHGLVYGDQWCLDHAAWTAPGEVAGLRNEDAGVGGDAWEARSLIRPAIIAGQTVLGQRTVGDAMCAALEQAEALLLPRRGALLRLSGHLLEYGRVDRATINAIMELPE